jgi:gamma-glutamyltranspeptidase/glutathione hydrolase
MRNFENPNRSVATAVGGMAATSHPASTLAAIRVLESGGNAMDAALAAVAVQCVVEPGSTGIGGDCFCLYAPKGSDQVIAYNGSGRAPAAATTEYYEKNKFSKIPAGTPHAVTIPGSVEAWCRLSADHGSMPLSDLFQPAIDLARNGFAVSPRSAADWTSQAALLAAQSSTAEIFLPNGKPPEVGEIRYQTKLADTLEAIGHGGKSAFYEGEIAQDMVDHLRSLGGLHTLEDFKATQGDYVTPIRTSFRGYDVVECPPAGQGIIALMIINILAGLPIAKDPLSADRLHAEIEATRLAYSIRDAILADPEVADVPVEWLLSEELAAELRAKIDLSKAITDLPQFTPPLHKDTVYITVIDKDRNTVSFINSLFALFGSGITAPKSGVLFQNRGEGFSLERGHPNCIASGKRPLHTIIPGMLTKDGRVAMSFGVMGGHYQAMGHAHFLSKVLDYGMDVQAAIELPRLFPIPGTDKVEVEATMPKATIEELSKRGFKFVKPARAIGGAQAISVSWETGTLQGGSDPRKDGCALGTVR